MRVAPTLDEIGLSTTTAVVDVWWACGWTVDDQLLSLLSPAETERMNTYRRPADRTRFAVGAALVRMASAGESGCSPAEVLVDRTCTGCGAGHGPPLVTGSASHLSLSHSGDVVVLARADQPVGVDVELVTEVDLALLQPSVLAPAEHTPADHHEFFVYWTRKESYLKARRVGLAVDLTTVTVSSPRQPPRLIDHEGFAPVVMSDLHPPADYTAALTVLGACELDVREMDAAELFSLPATFTV